MYKKCVWQRVYAAIIFFSLKFLPFLHFLTLFHYYIVKQIYPNRRVYMFKGIIKYISVVLMMLMYVGCGGSSSVQEAVKGDSEENSKAVSYINLSPTDTQVLTTGHPTFKFERNINNTSSAISCSSSTGTLHDVKLKVIKVDAQSANAISVVDEIIQVANECRFEILLPSLTLEENVGYAWRVSDPDTVEDASTVWNSFIYSTQSMGLEDTDPHECEKNMVQDWTFMEEKTPWRTAPVPQFSANLSATVLANGDEDSGAGQLQTPNEVLFQNLAYPVEQGKYYQLKFSLKHQGKSDFQIKALAFNGMLDSLQPDSNTSIIAFTGTMTDQNAWVKVTLPVWHANGNFNNLALALVNDENQTVSALIDRVCLVEVNASSGCGATLDSPGELPDGFDLNNSDPIITNFEYLAGTVSDLYPDYNTSTANWFEDINDSAMECSSIGEIISDEEQYQIDEYLLDEENIEENLTLLENQVLDLNYTKPSFDDSNLTSLPSTNNDKKCTDRIVDITKPFSGRDIVFIHGLQKNALDGHKNNPPTFRGRWPQDKADFYASPDGIQPNGEYYEEASTYWKTHIEAALGSFSNPSNSYLIANWSTNQHIPDAIHAVLTQVKDAMNRNNSGVTLSANGREKDQCFGDNGMVFVTHSTGGLVVSTLFGLIELEKNNTASPFYVEQSFIDKIDAQVGFDAAYRGSPIATAGLITEQRPNFDPTETILLDLGMPELVEYYRTIMLSSKKPTFILSGSMSGPPHNFVGSQVGASPLIRGFGDGVVSSWSQTNHVTKLPEFKYKKERLLFDPGIYLLRAARIYAKTIKNSLIPLFNSKARYYVTPYLSVSGMVQYNSVNSVTDPIEYFPNHYPIVQVSGDHFDNVNKIVNNGVNSYRISFDPNPNNEESYVVPDASLYTNGYLSPSFQTLNEEIIRKKTWGLHLPRVTWVPWKPFGALGPTLKKPRLTWYYHEFIVWKRSYHLLKDYKTKRGMDYMYNYLLKP